MKRDRHDAYNRWSKDTLLLLGLSGFTFALYFFTSGNYGIFRDELYYFACGEHLDFGYVDHPPIVALMAAVARFLFGDWLPGLRLPASLAIAATVFMAGGIARQLGGKRFAQGLAALTVIIAPAYQGMSNYLSMNALDILFWASIIYTLIVMINRDEPRLWLVIGLLAGVGIENKYSILFLMAALVGSLVFTELRRHFRTLWIWIGGAVAVVLVLPNVLWQHVHGWPFLVWQAAMWETDIAWISPQLFLKSQVLMMHPFSAVIWITGLGFLLFSPKLARYRILGIAWLIALALFMLKGSKVYYPAPSYLLLLPAGAVVFEQLLGRGKLARLKPVLVVLLVFGGLLTLPYGLPVLPIESFIAYDHIVKLEGDTRFEDGRQIPLRQHYADRFGWENMVREVARVVNSLGDEEKGRVTIIGGGYGNAGAVDFYRHKYGLPRAISPNLTYWIWGPGDNTGEITITCGRIPPDALEPLFEEVTEAGFVRHEYALFYETDYPIYLCRRPKVPIAEMWKTIGMQF